MYFVIPALIKWRKIDKYTIKEVYKWINLQFFISQRSTFILQKLLLLILFVIDSHTVNNKQESKCLPLKVAFDVGFKHNGQIGLGLGRYHLGERAALTQFPTINLFINIIYLYMQYHTSNHDCHIFSMSSFINIYGNIL